METFADNVLNEVLLTKHLEIHRGSRKAFVKAVLFDILETETNTIKKNNYSVLMLMKYCHEKAGNWYDLKRNNNNRDS